MEYWERKTGGMAVMVLQYSITPISLWPLIKRKIVHAPELDE